MNQSGDVNLLPIAEEYFNTMFTQIPGMKALILDFQTIGMISVIFSQSKLFKKDVYLIQRITDKGEKMQHLKAVYFVRPTPANLELIKSEIKDPKYMEYHLFFTNQITSKQIETLANNDPSDRIKTLQEVYLDFFAIARNAFTLNISSTASLNKVKDLWGEEQKALIERMYQGILSVIMSLRVIPAIRYLGNSETCNALAQKLAHKLELEFAEKKSDYRIDEDAILIITERRQDVVTPLLIPWTYQAMIHEFIGIANNKVDIVNKQKKIILSSDEPAQQHSDKNQFVLSQIDDEFYKNNLFKTFGDLASNIKRFIDDVGKKRNKAITIESLEDMHSALDMMPQLSQISANVAKHVTVSQQISKQITKNKSMQVSQLQQNLICQESKSENIDSIWKLLKNPNINSFDKLKIVLLFTIKYPNQKQIKQYMAYLSTIITDKRYLSLSRTLQLYQSKRKSDLFHNSNITKKAKSFFKDMFKDVPNVYTQHKCYLFEALLPDILSGRVKQSQYPLAYQGSSQKGSNKPTAIIFQVGGTTFAQSSQANEFKHAKIVIGGSFVHNSKSFLAEVIQLGPEQQL